MSDNKPNISNLIRTITPTQLGKKPKATVNDLQVAKSASAKFFQVIGGEVKVPRKRQTSEQWPEWFAELEAPTILYFYMEEGKEPIQVHYNEESELFEAKDEEGNVTAQYTGDNVAEMANPDVREVSGPPEALQQLRNAITQFNTKTGKKLATRFVKAKRDSSGRTIEQTEAVYRLR